MTLAVDQPRITLPAWASFRAPATRHLIRADPRPPLEGADLPDLLLLYRDIYPDHSQLRRPRWSRHSRRGRV